MRLPVSFLSFVLFLSACGGNDNPSSGILPPRKMKPVMWEMLQADYYTNQFVRTDSTRNAQREMAAMQEQIFHRHGVSRADYEKSYAYYCGKPDLMKALMDSVAASGEHERNLLMRKRNRMSEPVSN